MPIVDSLPKEDNLDRKQVQSEEKIQDPEPPTSNLAEPVTEESWMSTFLRRITFGALGAAIKTSTASQHPGVLTRVIPSEKDSAHRKAALAEHHLLSSTLPFFRSEFLEHERKIIADKAAICAARQSLLDRFNKSTSGQGNHEDVDEVLVRADEVAIPPQPQTAASNASGTVDSIYKAAACTKLIDTGDGTYLNTFIMDSEGEISNLTQPAKQNLVIAHGFGAGIGFWYKNYSAWSSIPGLRVFSIDWLGMGRSSRLELPPKAGSLGSDEDIDAVENYFVESLEKWRKACHIEKMVLMGHSLGGYFSTAYALKYPERVEKLILASPAGIPPKQDMTNFLKEANPVQRRLIGMGMNLWDSGYTPQSLVRGVGPFGRDLIRQYCTRRFVGMSSEDMEAIINYMHSITVLPGSGEYALNRILEPGAWGRRPLATKLTQLKMPVTFIYGSFDWMNPSIPIKLSQDGALHPGSKIILIPDAGHQLFLDNPSFFNKVIAEELNDTKR